MVIISFTFFSSFPFHVSLFNHVTLTPFYHTTMLPCHLITMLPCCHVTILPCHHFTLFPSLSHFNPVIPSKNFVATCNHLFARCETFKHFVIKRVLTTNANISFGGRFAIFIEYKNPLAACALEETTTGQKYCFYGLSKFETNVVGLSGTQIIGCFAGKVKIHSEPAVAYFGVNFGHLNVKQAILSFKCSI